MSSRRQKASANRSAAFWAARMSAARSPEDRAAVEWDRLRSEVRKLPRACQDAAWSAVADTAAAARGRVTGSELHTGCKHPGDLAA